jgi:hypothetical protein
MPRGRRMDRAQPKADRCLPIRRVLTIRWEGKPPPSTQVLGNGPVNSSKGQQAQRSASGHVQKDGRHASVSAWYQKPAVNRLIRTRRMQFAGEQSNARR